MKAAIFAVLALAFSAQAFADWGRPGPGYPPPPPPPGWGPGPGGPGPGYPPPPPPPGPGWGPGPGPGYPPPPPPPGYWQCTVTFQKCDFELAGNCLKWNNKGFQVNRRDAYYGCQMAQQQYGRIRNCYVNCPH